MDRQALRDDYARHIDKVNRATDRDINEAMDEILRKQSQLNVLRPAPDKFRPIRLGTQVPKGQTKTRCPA